MTVYIESNFVLEQALEQEQCGSCEALVKIAGDRTIRILIPAFCLAEPHIALMHKGNERSRFIPELRKHLAELARSKSYQKDSPAFTEIVSLVIASEDRERAQLEAAVDALLNVAEIIPLTSEIFQEAKGFQAKFDMSFQDSVVLSSVIGHLRDARPAESCFPGSSISSARV